MLFGFVFCGMTPGMRLDALPDDKKPSACIQCGQCSHACPQGIDVPKVMEELAELYAKTTSWAQASKPRQESIRKDLNMN